MPSQRLKSFVFPLLALFFLSGSASALYFRLDGDRLWLQAEQTPLVDILDQFARLGERSHHHQDVAGPHWLSARPPARQ